MDWAKIGVDHPKQLGHEKDPPGTRQQKWLYGPVKAVVGHGDNLSYCMTIMKPWQLTIRGISMLQGFDDFGDSWIGGLRVLDFCLCSDGDGLDWRRRLDGLDIGMHQEIGSNDTLIIIIIIEDNTFDHMLSKSGFHGNDNRTVGGDDGSIDDFNSING
uniref:Uncharacterized protein n=1 Tax=Romanomermis culicivorax TaxID=13658 RepID=A0A915J8D4_ROMCU